MILGLFGRHKKESNRRIVLGLYETLTSAARQPVLYERLGVPDTVMGRFEAVAVHVILFLRRSASGSDAVKAVGQDILDEFFLEVDHSIRELGIGDVSVPKKMKKFARMFYGRAQTYGTALDGGDRAALADALRRNLYPAAGEAAPDLGAMAGYLCDADTALARTGDDAILSGRVALDPAIAASHPEEPA